MQVDYALEAVRKGTCAVGVRGKDCVVLAVEKKSVLQLQDPRTVRKTAMLDDHICLGFAGASCSLAPSRSSSPPKLTSSPPSATGLTADARILIDRARIECQSHRLTVEDPVTVEYITRHIAGIQQVRRPPLLVQGRVRRGPRARRRTLTPSLSCAEVHPVWRRAAVRHLVPHHRLRPRRPSPAPLPHRAQRHLLGMEGASRLLFLLKGPRLLPSSSSHCAERAARADSSTSLLPPSQANAVGRSSKTVREFLEKQYTADLSTDETIQLAVKALLEVVPTGAANIDLAVMDGFGSVRVRLTLSPSRPCLSSATSR